MLSIRYSDPPETEKETKARKDSKGPEPKNNFENRRIHLLVLPGKGYGSGD